MGLIAEWIELQNKLESERCKFRKEEEKDKEVENIKKRYWKYK